MLLYKYFILDTHLVSMIYNDKCMTNPTVPRYLQMELFLTSRLLVLISQQNTLPFKRSHNLVSSSRLTIYLVSGSIPTWI